VQRLMDFADYELVELLPQLCQVLKYEPYHDNALVRFLMERCLRNPYQVVMMMMMILIVMMMRMRMRMHILFSVMYIRWATFSSGTSKLRCTTLISASGIIVCLHVCLRACVCE
jgi:hypothetical protein